MTSSDGSENRRVGDWTSWSAAGVLLLLLPASIFCSVVLMFPLSFIWPDIYWLVGIYFALGFFTLVPAGGNLLFKVAFPDAREPWPQEQAQLDAAWARVIELSGRTDGSKFHMRVIDSDDVNAVAGGGHMVFLTTAMLKVAKDDMLPGVLAHELGHHVGLHPFVCALQVWLMWPIIGAQWVAILLSNLAVSIANAFAGGIIGIIVGLVAMLLRGVACVLIGFTWLAIAVLRFVGRGAEYRADRYAVQIGLGVQLAAFLAELAKYEEQIDFDRARTLTDTICSTHPPTQKRLHRIQQHLV